MASIRKMRRRVAAVVVFGLRQGCLSRRGGSRGCRRPTKAFVVVDRRAATFEVPRGRLLTPNEKELAEASAERSRTRQRIPHQRRAETVIRKLGFRAFSSPAAQTGMDLVRARASCHSTNAHSCSASVTRSLTVTGDGRYGSCCPDDGQRQRGGVPRRRTVFCKRRSGNRGGEWSDRSRRIRENGQ